MMEQQDNKTERRLKRAVTKEEFVELVKTFCRDPKKKKKGVSAAYVTAQLLNQLLYWETRCRDYDAFQMEEYNLIQQMQQAQQRGGEPVKPMEKPRLTHGWVYKSAEALSEETMLDLTKTTILMHLDRLLGIGVLEKRNNPIYRWDRCTQYRINTIRLRQLLFLIGYNLEGWAILPPELQLPKETLALVTAEADQAQNTSCPNFGHGSPNIGHGSPNFKHASPENGHGGPDIGHRSPENGHRWLKNWTAIPETTTEITTETITEIPPETTSKIPSRKLPTAEVTAITTEKESTRIPKTFPSSKEQNDPPEWNAFIRYFVSSVYPLTDSEWTDLKDMTHIYGIPKVKVVIWKEYTHGGMPQDAKKLLNAMRAFLETWRSWERRKEYEDTKRIQQTNRSFGAGRRYPDQDVRPLSQKERNELRRYQIREKFFNGTVTEADLREQDRLAYEV